MVLGERFRLKRLHGHRFGLTLWRFVSRGFGLLQWFLGESWPVAWASHWIEGAMPTRRIRRAIRRFCEGIVMDYGFLVALAFVMAKTEVFTRNGELLKNVGKWRFFNRDTPKVAFLSNLSIFTPCAQREQKPRQDQRPFSSVG